MCRNALLKLLLKTLNLGGGELASVSEWCLQPLVQHHDEDRDSETNCDMRRKHVSPPQISDTR